MPASAPTPPLACALLPEWPLQILARANPSWREHPIVVVSSERASAELLLVDSRARAAGLRVGMRHGAARSLVPELRAGLVSEAQMREASAGLVERLMRRSPRVEVAAPGVFYLDPSGLCGGLYPSLERWAQSVRDDLASDGFSASVVVGFGRYRTLALARVAELGSVTIWPSAAAEHEATRVLPLGTFDAPTDLIRALDKLAIRRVSELSRLPPLELAMRFGPEALSLWQRIEETLTVPFSSVAVEEIVVDAFEIDPPDDDVERLLFALKASIDRVVARTRSRALAIARLELELALDHGPAHLESLEPAAPTLEGKLLVELLRLRLAAVALPAPVAAVRLTVVSAPADPRQLSLWQASKARDVEAAARAIARLRAAFGPETATCAVTREGHLLEARSAYEPTMTVSLPQLHGRVRDEILVRRLLVTPHALPEDGAMASLVARAGRGPFRTDGGWWMRSVRRDYFYVETEHGEIRVVYRDALRGRWFLHGEVD